MARIMGILKCAVILLLADSSMVHFRVMAGDSMDIEDSFVYHGVVPDVISEAPEEIVYVTHPSGAVVNLGDELTPTLVKDQPTLEWDAEEETFYTIIMTDPDAPSRAHPTFREWHHWLVGNVRGNNIASGDVLSAYVGAGPGLHSGLHRYVYLVYEQPGWIDFDEPILPNTSAEHRHHFSTAKFTKKYNLGVPIAGNFYQAEYDDYVPILHEQLGL